MTAINDSNTASALFSQRIHTWLAGRYLPWVLWMAIGVTLAAVVMAQATVLPSRYWLLIYALLAALAIWQWRLRRWLIVSPLLLGLLLGATLMQERLYAWQAETIPSIWQGVNFQATIRVDGVARQTAKGGWSVPVVIVDAPSSVLVDKTILASFTAEREPVAGEVWPVNMRLHSAQGRFNPGGFDYLAWLFSQDIQGTANVYLQKSADIQQSWHWQAWRWQAMKRMQSVLPEQSEFSGLSVALVLGEASAVTAEQWQVLRDTGTLHMAVVSGTHITLISGMAWFLALFLWRLKPSERIPAEVFASIIALIAAVAFAFLAGMDVPVQRAIIMFMMLVLGVWLRRSLPAVLTLSWALLLVLLWDIAAVLQPGFWLSFIATAILLSLMRMSSGKVKRLLLLHLGMSVLLAPFLWFFFAEIPTYSALANLLASPIMEWLLVPLLFVIALLAWVLPSLAAWLAELADVFWQFAWSMLSWIANLPLAVLVLSAQSFHPAADEHIITLLDTGKDEVVAVWQTKGHAWLIGIGDQQGKTHSVDSVVVPSLAALGIHQLDGVLLTKQSQYHDAALRHLQSRIAVQQVLSADELCHPQTSTLFSDDIAHQRIEWQQDESGYCWLVAYQQQQPIVELTWQAPTYQAASTTGVARIAPAVSHAADHDLQAATKPVWISPLKAAHGDWASESYHTQAWGAMSWRFRPKGADLLVSYRQQQQRFYHREQE